MEFSSLRFVEYSDLHVFIERARRWMMLREAENCATLGQLSYAATQADNPAVPRPRLFTVEDRGVVVMAAMLFHGTDLFLTWASPDMLATFADGLFRAGARPIKVCAPNHVPWQFARFWTQLVPATFDITGEERVYQVARLKPTALASGQIRPATSADNAILTPWLGEFVQETHYLIGEVPIDQLRDTLLREFQVFLWLDPEPVAMAAFVNPTDHGGVINFVYVPRHLRGRGYGKAVTTGVVQHMLNAGRLFCFILTDIHDRRTNHIYQAIGARPVCDLVQWTFTPKAAPAPAGTGPVIHFQNSGAAASNRPAGGLNIVNLM